MSEIKPLNESDLKCSEIEPLPETSTIPSNYVRVAATLIDEKGNKYGPINMSVHPEYLKDLPKIQK